MNEQVVAEALGAIKDRLTTQDATLSRIETKATETNSRVTKLEEWKVAEEAIKRDRHNRNWKRTTAWTGLGGGCGALLGYIGHAAGLW